MNNKKVIKNKAFLSFIMIIFCLTTLSCGRWKRGTALEREMEKIYKKYILDGTIDMYNFEKANIALFIKDNNANIVDKLSGQKINVKIDHTRYDLVLNSEGKADVEWELNIENPAKEMEVCLAGTNKCVLFQLRTPIINRDLVFNKNKDSNLKLLRYSDFKELTLVEIMNEPDRSKWIRIEKPISGKVKVLYGPNSEAEYEIINGDLVLNPTKDQLKAMLYSKKILFKYKYNWAAEDEFSWICEGCDPQVLTKDVKGTSTSITLLNRSITSLKIKICAGWKNGQNWATGILSGILYHQCKEVVMSPGQIETYVLNYPRALLLERLEEYPEVQVLGIVE